MALASRAASQGPKALEAEIPALLVVGADQPIARMAGTSSMASVRRLATLVGLRATSATLRLASEVRLPSSAMVLLPVVPVEVLLLH